MTDLEQLLQEALKLPDAERTKLAARILESVPEADLHSVEPSIDAVWLVEARRRSVELRSGEVQGVPWHEVESRLFSK